MKKRRILPLSIVVTALVCMGLFICRDVLAGFECSRLLDIERVVTNPVIEDFDCEDCVCFSSQDGSLHKATLVKFKITGGLTTVNCFEDPNNPGIFRPCECDDLEEYDAAKGADLCDPAVDSNRSGLFSSIEVQVERVINEVECDDPGSPQQCCVRGKENVRITICDDGGCNDGSVVYKQKRRSFGLGVVGVTDLRTELCCDPFRNQVTTVLVPDTTEGPDCRTDGCVVRLLYESEIDFDVFNPCDEAEYVVDNLKISGIEDCKQCDPPL